MKNKNLNIEKVANSDVVMHCTDRHDFHKGVQVTHYHLESWHEYVLTSLEKDKDKEVHYIQSGNGMVIGCRDKETGIIEIFEISRGFEEFTYEPFHEMTKKLNFNDVSKEINGDKRNAMSVTKPEQMTSGTSEVEEAVNKFEEQFAKDEKDQQYYHLIVIGEYSRQTCNEIERIYTEAGWSKVKCKTSSENGERGGLTGLQLYRS